MDNVKIQYSEDNGLSWITIVTSIINTGFYRWDPIPEIDSAQCLVKIIDVDNPDTNDLSDIAFTITDCPAWLTADLTGDCNVDFEDLAVLASQWLMSIN